jgi:hypothetical protein
MCKHHWITHKVHCIRDGIARFITMEYVDSDGALFPLPCNGCEFLDGHEACNVCIADLTNSCFAKYKEDLSRLHGVSGNP